MPVRPLPWPRGVRRSTTAPMTKAPQWPSGAAEITVVLAADLLDPAPVVKALLEVARRRAPGIEAWVPQDAGGVLQTLACAITTEALKAAIEQAAEPHGSLENASMMRLLATVQMERLKLPEVDFSDIDTPGDAGRHGITVANGH